MLRWLQWRGKEDWGGVLFKGFRRTRLSFQQWLMAISSCISQNPISSSVSHDRLYTQWWGCQFQYVLHWELSTYSIETEIDMAKQALSSVAGVQALPLILPQWSGGYYSTWKALTGAFINPHSTCFHFPFRLWGFFWGIRPESFTDFIPPSVPSKAISEMVSKWRKSWWYSILG